jgi:alkanesulfonate monooxygenase SsuD/methylene tetrahydromethanopterin reductase-like flavin-dependent oxidoreductase (luciferase family)
MKYGVMVSTYGELASPRVIAALARETEAAGWDGFFLWDHIATASSPRGERAAAEPLIDTWVALTVVAMNTERIRFGPRVTPTPRRRPWKLARETVSLDHLSGGRLILGVGSGFPPIVDAEFTRFGEPSELRVRTELLDEGLDVLAGLWSGEPFSFHGEHYRVRDVTFLPRPFQAPRIPIWVAATWPSKAPFRRAARWDGVCIPQGDGRLTPDELRAAVAYTKEHRRGTEPFDVSWAGFTPGDDPRAGAAMLAPFVEAGLTWWIESFSPQRGSPEDMRLRIQQGPPRV